MKNFQEIQKDEDIKKFLVDNRKKIIVTLAQRYNYDIEDIKDAYQNASVELYLKYKEGDLHSENNASLYTFFYSICKNQLLNIQKEEHKFQSSEKEIERLSLSSYSDDKTDEILRMGEPDFTIEKPDRDERIRKIVEELPHPCKEIIWYVYDDNLTMDDISQLLNYKNANTVKSTKSRCISKLQAKLEKEGIFL